MSDHPVRTLVHTEEGDMPFQHYFVRKRCEPTVIDVSFVGADSATATVAVLDAIEMADAIVIAPSNPYLSIDPILSIPGIRESLRTAAASVVAVSPIIDGQAIKGPAAKLMSELGQIPSAATVATYYGKLIDGFVLDRQDVELQDMISGPTRVTNTIMKTLDDKAVLALDVLDFVQELSNQYLDACLGEMTSRTVADSAVDQIR
jgi:LPPG:FO 2-phospho-L-lactate transferase